MPVAPPGPVEQDCDDQRESTLSDHSRDESSSHAPHQPFELPSMPPLECQATNLQEATENSSDNNCLIDFQRSWTRPKRNSQQMIRKPNHAQVDASGNLINLDSEGLFKDLFHDLDCIEEPSQKRQHYHEGDLLNRRSFFISSDSLNLADCSFDRDLDGGIQSYEISKQLLPNFQAYQPPFQHQRSQDDSILAARSPNC